MSLLPLRLIPILTLLLTLWSCRGGQEIPGPWCAEGTCTYELIRDTRLLIDTTQDGRLEVSLGSGQEQVLHYTYQADDNPQIADDEYGEELYIRLPMERDTFAFSGAILAEHAFFRAICFCPYRGYVPVTEGSVQGRRLSQGRWEISVDIVASPWAGSFIERAFTVVVGE